MRAKAMAAARLGGGAAWPDRGQSGLAERGRPRGGVGARGAAQGGVVVPMVATAAAQQPRRPGRLGGGGAGRRDGQWGRADPTRVVARRRAA